MARHYKLPQKITDFLQSVGISIVGYNDVNTTNGWGFDGALKTVYKLSNGFSIHKGIVSYRHAPDSAFISLRNGINDGEILARGINGIIAKLEQMQK